MKPDPLFLPSSALCTCAWVPLPCLDPSQGHSPSEPPMLKHWENAGCDQSYPWRTERQRGGVTHPRSRDEDFRF